MTMSRVEVIASVQRRRRWSREEKKGLVAPCLAPGVSVSHVARRTGFHSRKNRMVGLSGQTGAVTGSDLLPRDLPPPSNAKGAPKGAF